MECDIGLEIPCSSLMKLRPSDKCCDDVFRHWKMGCTCMEMGGDRYTCHKISYERATLYYCNLVYKKECHVHPLSGCDTGIKLAG